MRHKKYIGPDTNIVYPLSDNFRAIALSNNLDLNERSKHIDICHHYVHDLARNGSRQVLYVPIADIVAHGMIKPLQRIDFERFKDQLGIVSR
jgi:hypothetical protein